MVSARSSFLVVTGTSLDTQLRLYRALPPQAGSRTHSVTRLVHKGSRFHFAQVRRHASFPAHSLVIPCAARTIDAVVEWQRMGVLAGGKAPYYFTMDLMAEPNFEPRDGGRLFGGRIDMWTEGHIRANAELFMRDSKNRAAIADQCALARYNCATLALGIVAHVARVPLVEIDAELARVTRSSAFHGWVGRRAPDDAQTMTGHPAPYFVTGRQPVRIAALTA